MEAGVEDTHQSEPLNDSVEFTADMIKVKVQQNHYLQFVIKLLDYFDMNKAQI